MQSQVLHTCQKVPWQALSKTAVFAVCSLIMCYVVAHMRCESMGINGHTHSLVLVHMIYLLQALAHKLVGSLLQGQGVL